MTPAEHHVRAARARLTSLRPYFDHAVYALVLVEAPGCPTIAVDQWRRLYFSPRFVLAHSVEQVTTLLLHELGHVLRDHHQRARAFGVTEATAAAANIAMDCPINEDIRVQVETWKDTPHLPAGSYYPETIGAPGGQTWEAYYQLLLENPHEAPVSGGGTFDPLADGDDGPAAQQAGKHDCGSGAHGIARRWEVGSPENSGVEGVGDADWRDVQQITAEQIADHRYRGKVPSDWLEWAKDLLRPKRIPWDQELAGAVRASISDRAGMLTYSYKRPSRRSQACPDFILPAMRQPEPVVAIIGDTSGSMVTDLPLIRGTVQDVCEGLGSPVVFLSTDAAVHGGAQRATDGRTIEIRGGGGTDMGAGIRYAEEQLTPRPDVLVVITDCETPWPAKPPTARVIVCAVGSSPAIEEVPKWAKTIRVSP